MNECIEDTLELTDCIGDVHVWMNRNVVKKEVQKKLLKELFTIRKVC